jgi:hypothetical protein
MPSVLLTCGVCLIGGVLSGFIASGSMIGCNDTSKGARGRYEESFQREGNLVEGGITAGCSKDSESSKGKTTKASQNTALKGSPGGIISMASYQPQMERFVVKMAFD